MGGPCVVSQSRDGGRIARAPVEGSARPCACSRRALSVRLGWLRAFADDRSRRTDRGPGPSSKRLCRVDGGGGAGGGDDTRPDRGGVVTEAIRDRCCGGGGACSTVDPRTQTSRSGPYPPDSGRAGRSRGVGPDNTEAPAYAFSCLTRGGIRCWRDLRALRAGWAWAWAWMACPGVGGDGWSRGSTNRANRGGGGSCGLDRRVCSGWSASAAALGANGGSRWRRPRSWSHARARSGRRCCAECPSPLGRAADACRCEALAAPLACGPASGGGGGRRRAASLHSARSRAASDPVPASSSHPTRCPRS